MGIGLLWCSMGEGESKEYYILFCRLLLFNCSWMNKRKAKKKLKSGLFCKWYICTLGWLETTKYKIQKRETPISVPFLICSLRFFLILFLSPFLVQLVAARADWGGIVNWSERFTFVFFFLHCPTQCLNYFLLFFSLLIITIQFPRTKIKSECESENKIIK